MLNKYYNNKKLYKSFRRSQKISGAEFIDGESKIIKQINE